MDKDDDMETQRTKIKITDLNPHLTCILCGGYFIDATTIIECLHPFCRACIVRYLESSKFCPICEVMVHKTRPLQNIRSDETLQDLVYKLVPGLYRNEMKRRRDFYANNNNRVRNASNKNQLPTTTTSGEDRGDEALQRLIYTGDESISLSLELCTGRTEERLKFLTKENLNGNNKNKNKEVRYLLCPAAFTVAHIKKFLRMKFELGPNYEIQIFHSEEPLKETYTLIDIAYIYTWRRNAPLRLSYSVFENDNKKPRLTMPESVREGHHLKDPHRSIQIPVSVTNTNSNNSHMNSTMTDKATSKINTNSTAIVPKVSTSGTTTSNSNGLHPSQHPPAVSQTSCNPTVVTSSSCTVSSSCTTPMEVTPSSSSNNSSHNNHNQVPKGKPPVNDSAVFHKPALPPQKHSQGLKAMQASKPLQPIAPKPQSDLNRRPPTFIAPKSPSHSVQLTASKVSMAGIPKHHTMHHQQQQQQQQHLHHQHQHQHHHHQQHQHQHHQQQNLMQKSLNNEKFTANSFQPPSPSPSPSPVVIPKPGINSANVQRIIQPGTLKIPQNYGQKNAQTNWQKMPAAGLHKPVHTNGTQKSLPMSPATSGNKLQPGCSNNCTGGNMKAGSRSEVCLVPKSESKKLADAIMNGNKAGNSSKSELFGATTMPAPKSAKKDGTNDGNKDKLMKINGNASKTEIAGVS